MNDFLEWCGAHFLQDMVINFRKTPHLTCPIVIKGSLVETVECYKYLGTVIDNNLGKDERTAL